MNKIISTRATQLEKFTSCPYSYKFAEPLVGNETFLNFGTDFHKILELSLHWKRDGDWIGLLLQSYGIKERDLLMKGTQVILDELSRREYTPIIDECNLRYTHKDKVFISWTFDYLFRDKDWKAVLCDWKTSASKYTKDFIKELWQYKIYSALLYKQYWIKVDRFEYFVVIKKSKPELQVVPFDIPETCYEMTLEAMLDTFVKAHEDNVWEPKKNYKCFFCKLWNECWDYVSF